MEQEDQSTPQDTETGQSGGTEQNSGQDIGNEKTQENNTPEGDSVNEQSPGQSSEDTENIEDRDASSEDGQPDPSELDIDESTGNPGLG